MTQSLPPQQIHAFLLGNGSFPKDEALADIPNMAANLQALAQALANEQVAGISPQQATRLLDVADNTKIKEELAAAAEKAQSGLLFYVSGYVVSRKGQLYLATSGSSRSKIHLNGVAFDDLSAILQEANPALPKILLLDAGFLDAQEEEFDATAIALSLRQFQAQTPNLLLLAASPALSIEAFMGYADNTIFTQGLAEVLQHGTVAETPELTCAQLAAGITAYLQGKGLKPEALLAGSDEAKAWSFARNTRYAAFHDLKGEGDALFRDAHYKEAMLAYKRAAELLPSHEEVQAKRRFIQAFLKGQEAAEAAEYALAKERFAEAFHLLPEEAAKLGMLQALNDWAQQLFEQEQFEAARERYKEILLLDPHRIDAQQRFEACQQELQFQDLMDEADQRYFANDFGRALACYEQALGIHNDRKAVRRKAECERLLEKELIIRERIAEQLAEEQLAAPAMPAVNEDILRKEIELQLRDVLPDELRPQVEEALRPALAEEIRQALLPQLRQEAYAEALAEAQRQAKPSDETKKQWMAEAKQQFEEEFWTNALLANQLEVYRFYLQFFPRPKYTEKAKARINDLKALQEKALAEEAALANMTSEPIQAGPIQAEPIQAGPIQAGPIQEEVAQEVAVQEEVPQADAGQEEAVQEATVPAEPAAEAPETALPLAEEQTPRQEVPKPELSEQSPQDIIEQLEATFNGVADVQEVPKDEAPAAPVRQAALSEEELWEQACLENTPESYRFYVEHTKESDHVVDAYYQINQLTRHQAAASDDDAPRRPAAPARSNGAYTYSVQIAPETPAAVEEEEAPAPVSAEEKRLWEQADAQHTVAGYYEYISKSSEKAHLEEAKSRINTLKSDARQSETTDWEAALQEDTVEGFKNYIRKYPLGDYYAKAMFRISELEARR